VGGDVAERGESESKSIFNCFSILTGTQLAQNLHRKVCTNGGGRKVYTYSHISASIANSLSGFPAETLFTWLTHVVTSDLWILKLLKAAM
jgi:hypothetical protein